MPPSMLILTPPTLSHSLPKPVIRPSSIRLFDSIMDSMTRGKMLTRVSILPRVIESMIESKSLIELGLITGFGNEWLRVGGVKMSIDGGITGRNACFYDPYEDDEHNHGIIRIA